MRNFVQPGKTITVPAPYDVSSGDPVLVGAIFGVASHDALSGEDLELVREGVFDLKKAASQAWTSGAKVYFDAAAKGLTSTATSNTLVGAAAKAVGSGAGETIGRVLLSGQIA
jgi:predicted RecA/RadA family phage recombinase